MAARTISPAQFLQEFKYALLLFAVLLAVADFAPHLGARWFRQLESALGRLARRQALSLAVVGLLAFSVSAIVSRQIGIPPPSIHDEFSYLLAADTFAHGRLSNSPHPMWVHFETFHVLQQPTYASKYPPGQGMMLALGQVLTGQPIVGAWISAGLACAALCWMLYAWMPPRWALLGGLLAALHPLVLTWSSNYWGGLVAATGGALVVGALRRLAMRVEARMGVALGVGMAILANSRPYEGAVLSLCCLVVLGVWMARTRVPVREGLRRVALPLGGVLLATGLWMAYYNYRVTHHPFLMPYVLHQKTYDAAPAFVFQSRLPEPVYRHKILHDFHTGSEFSYYARQRSLSGWATDCVSKIQTLLIGSYRLFTAPIPTTEIGDPGNVYAVRFGTLLLFPLLTLPWAFRRERWMRLALLLVLVSVLAYLPETWFFPHYAAPIFGLLLLFLVQGLRYLRAWRLRGRPVGLLLVRSLLVLYVVSLFPVSASLADYVRTKWGVQRVRLLDSLRQQGGKHLIIVHYDPGHVLHNEKVYNAADIDSAPVVWARDMGRAGNQELIDYFRGRRVWLLNADRYPLRLEPYSGAPAIPPPESSRGTAVE